MASDSNLIPASVRLFNLFTVLTCSNIASQYCLLLLNLSNLSCTIWGWRTVSIPRHATVSSFIWLLRFCVWSRKSIAIVLCTVCWHCILLGLLSYWLWLTDIHELRGGWLLNSWFYQLFILCLINTTYSSSNCIWLCSCSATLVI